MQPFIQKFLIISGLVFWTLIVAENALGAFLPPHQFYGTVNFANGKAAPDGTLVEAKIDGKVVATCPIKDGKYGYNPFLCFIVDDSENSYQGKEIHFYINGIDTAKTEVFENGGFKKLDFSLPNVEAGVIERNENETIASTTIVIVPKTPTEIKMGESLVVSFKSSTSTHAVVEKIEKLGKDFFTGAAAIISGKKLLNGYDIKMSAENKIEIKVTMKYDDTGIDEDSVAPYKFDGTSWVAIQPFTLDKSANTVTFNISSANTPYVVFGSPVSTSGRATGGGATGGGSRGGGAAVSDRTPPSISEINVKANRTTAEISWKTNEPSISWILYGTTTNYGKEIKTTAYTTSHSITLTELIPGTTYHFQIKSKDSAGNIGTSEDKTFTTLKPRIIGDINDDGKVDKYDFALMMSDWGKTGLNIPSDLNQDGKVDKYDFSLLMANWTK